MCKQNCVWKNLTPSNKARKCKYCKQKKSDARKNLESRNPGIGAVC